MRRAYRHGLSAVLHHRDGHTTDVYGNDTRVFIDVQLPHVAFWQTNTAEVTLAHQDTVTTTSEALLPTGVAVSVDDELTVDGRRWSIAGLPVTPRSPFTGTAPGVHVHLRRIS